MKATAIPESKLKRENGGSKMSVDVAKLSLRVAALETQMGMTAAADEVKKEDEKAEKKEASERETLASEIEAMERKIGSIIADEKVDEKKVEEKKEDAKEEKKASEVDKSGVEEQITQKKFTEVEKLEHGKELATEPTTLDAAPTEYVARLMNASVRLDAVAEYLEKTGRSQMALRIDRIADAIDVRIASIKTK